MSETPNEIKARQYLRLAAALLMTDPDASHERDDIVAMATAETEHFMEEVA